MAFIAPEGYRWGEEPKHPYYAKDLLSCYQYAVDLCKKKDYKYLQISHMVYAMLETKPEVFFSLHMQIFSYVSLHHRVAQLVTDHSIQKEVSNEPCIIVTPVNTSFEELIRWSKQCEQQAGVLDLLELLLTYTQDETVRLCREHGVSSTSVSFVRRSRQTL